MYRPRLFDIEDSAVLSDFMHAQSFALLVTATDGAPVASHIPLLLDSGKDGGGEHGRLLGHVAKANNQWQAFDGKTEAMAIFWGPHAYISPNWYESEKMVPTWNYVTVHAYGKPKVISDPAGVADIIKRLTDTYESDATGNWSMDSLPKDFVEKQLKGIVAFEMPIERLEGKFKLSQNRQPKDREGAIKGLRQTGDAEAEEVARLMAEFNPDN
jgi:transcriptional regulator